MNEPPQPSRLDAPALIDTAVWSWVRDRRFPELAEWFNGEAAAARILICDLVVLELVRTAPNRVSADAIVDRLAAFKSVPAAAEVWPRAREVQLRLSRNGDHRRVPPTDLLIAATAELAGVAVIHYDRDYDRIAAVTGQPHAWFVPDGSLAD